MGKPRTEAEPKWHIQAEFYIRNAKMLAYGTEALATEAEAETKAFSVETEAKTKTFSLAAEARPRRLKFQPRRDRAEALLRLEKASRPRRQDRGHISGRTGRRRRKKKK